MVVFKARNLNDNPTRAICSQPEGCLCRFKTQAFSWFLRSGQKLEESLQESRNQFVEVL